jgi:hypothetical protein
MRTVVCGSFGFPSGDCISAGGGLFVTSAPSAAARLRARAASIAAPAAAAATIAAPPADSMSPTISPTMRAASIAAAFGSGIATCWCGAGSGGGDSSGIFANSASELSSGHSGEIIVSTSGFTVVARFGRSSSTGGGGGSGSGAAVATGASGTGSTAGSASASGVFGDETGVRRDLRGFFGLSPVVTCFSGTASSRAGAARRTR